MKCKQCEINKPASDFYEKEGSKTGRMSVCIPCHIENTSKPKPKKPCTTCGKEKTRGSFSKDPNKNECNACLVAYDYFRKNPYWLLARRLSRAYRTRTKRGVVPGDRFVPHASSVNRKHHSALEKDGKPFLCILSDEKCVYSENDKFPRTEWHFEDFNI